MLPSRLLSTFKVERKWPGHEFRFTLKKLCTAQKKIKISHIYGKISHIYTLIQNKFLLHFAETFQKKKSIFIRVFDIKITTLLKIIVI